MESAVFTASAACWLGRNQVPRASRGMVTPLGRVSCSEKIIESASYVNVMGLATCVQEKSRCPQEAVGASRATYMVRRETKYV